MLRAAAAPPARLTVAAWRASTPPDRVADGPTAAAVTRTTAPATPICAAPVPPAPSDASPTCASVPPRRIRSPGLSAGPPPAAQEHLGDLVAASAGPPPAAQEHLGDLVAALPARREPERQIVDFGLQEFDDPAQCEPLVAIYQAVFAAPPYCETFAHDAVVGMFREFFARGGWVLVERNGDDPAAHGFLAGYPCETRPTSFWIEELGVALAFRRRGIARALVQAAGERARREGFEAIELRTSESNDSALRFYGDLQFERTAETAVVPKKGINADGQTDVKVYLRKPLTA